jgi:ABC-type polysaccharide/polyol phosphate transport system ATPase subunit
VSAASQQEPAASTPAGPVRPAAVAVDALSKTFSIPHQQATTLKERVLHPRASARHKLLQALRDVSFEVPQGEFFGIVGRNGSGKSTLLKCLAGIYAPTSGTVDVQGRLGTFIELGVGFNPELAARDNVMVNATMLGLTRKEAADAFPAILEFAELQEFKDLKLKNYSSGMHVRLAFSTAIQMETDVLLVDEVLAVGDSAFQQKCFEQFQRLKDEGRTILFVTHDMNAVKRFCDRAMLLERGDVVLIDDPVSVGRRYHELNFKRTDSAGPQEGEERYGDQREAEITSVWFEQPAGTRQDALLSGQGADICIEIWTREELRDPTFNVELRNEAHLPLFVASSQYHDDLPEVLEAGRRYVVRLSFQCLLGPGRYSCTPVLLRGAGAADIVDLRPEFGSIMIHAVDATGGLAMLPHEFSVQEL